MTVRPKLLFSILSCCLKLQKQAEAATPVKSIPFSGMRKSIAENMHSSLHNTAQLTTFTEVDVTEMGIGDSKHIDEVSIDESFELVDETNFTIVTVLSPKAEEEEEVEEEEGEEAEEEGAEGEVVFLPLDVEVADRDGGQAALEADRAREGACALPTRSLSWRLLPLPLTGSATPPGVPRPGGSAAGARVTHRFRLGEEAGAGPGAWSRQPRAHFCG